MDTNIQMNDTAGRKRLFLYNPKITGNKNSPEDRMRGYFGSLIRQLARKKI